nr:hypothetical protein Iba_chr04bCG16500 [Ipomoea batatas]
MLNDPTSPLFEDKQNECSQLYRKIGKEISFLLNDIPTEATRASVSFAYGLFSFTECLFAFSSNGLCGPKQATCSREDSGGNKVTMYDNQLYSTRFAPLEDMEEEMFIGKEPEHMTTHGIGNDDPQREMESNSEPLTETKAQELATAQTEGENGA